jgi:hypothetical protein
MALAILPAQGAINGPHSVEYVKLVLEWDRRCYALTNAQCVLQSVEENPSQETNWNPDKR